MTIKLDKSIGKWYNGYDYHITKLDNLAYHIYCDKRRNRMEINIAPQTAFLLHPKVYKHFYDEAENIIRIEKINKIKERI